MQFLKSVTPCTACGQKGHWQGDDACPKKRAGKPGAKGKHRPAPKRPAGKTTYFVLHPDLEENDQVAQALYVSPGTARAARTRDRVRFSNLAEHQGPATEHEVYVNLRTNLCAHASSRGGRERNYHPAANSHTRSIMCKEPECNKAVVQARRRFFLVQVALCAGGKGEIEGTVCQSRPGACRGPVGERSRGTGADQAV